MSYPIKKPGAPLKKNVLDILKTKAVKVTAHESYDKSQELIPGQLIEQKQNAEELALLRHQIQNSGNVNDFLLRKYTDGGPIGVAKEARYDNSKERIEAGICFEYHVYYPTDPADKFELANHRYIITPKVIDYRTGDHYYYHFPIRKFIHNNQFYYKIDYLQELITPTGIPVAPPDYPYNGDRLFSSLTVLAQRITNQNPHLDPYSMGVLQEHGFISEHGGKLRLDVPKDGVLVEKYFLKLAQDKRTVAMEYLSAEFGAPAPVVAPVDASAAAPVVAPVVEDDDTKLLEAESLKFQSFAFYSTFKTTVKVTKEMSLKEKIEAWKASGVSMYKLVEGNGAGANYPIYITFGKSLAVVYLKTAFGLTTTVLSKAADEGKLHLGQSDRRISTVIRTRSVYNRLVDLGLAPLLKKGDTPDNIFETTSFPKFTVQKI